MKKYNHKNIINLKKNNDLLINTVNGDIVYKSDISFKIINANLNRAYYDTIHKKIYTIDEYKQQFVQYIPFEKRL